MAQQQKAQQAKVLDQLSNQAAKLTVEQQVMQINVRQEEEITF